MQRAVANPGRVKLLLAFAAIYLIWGSTFLAIRLAVASLPPLVMMGTRHLVAGAVLYLWMRGRGAERPSARQWVMAAIGGGFLFLGCHGLLAWAEQSVPSGMAALLSSTVSLWMVLLARVRGQDSKLSLRVLSGIGLGFFGVAVLMGVGIGTHSWQTDPVRALAIVLCELCWAIGAIYGRGLKRAPSSGLFAAMQMLAGGALLWIVGLGLGEGSRLSLATLQPQALGSLAYMIVFGSLLAFTAYHWLLTVSTAAKVSTHAYVNPVVAVLLGWLLAGEPIVMRTVAGAAIILASVALVSARGKREEPVNEPAAAAAD